jgi:alkaline phosphatase D
LRTIVTLILLLLFTGITSAQSELLQSGPMVGYSTMREVKLWVQTTETAIVNIEYWNKENPSIIYSTNYVETEKKSAFAAHLIADDVEPGIKYEYRLLINGKPVDLSYKLEFQSQKLWQWREDPPVIIFRIWQLLLC